MALELPPQGSVVEYPYLWMSQSVRGETEGRKGRPVCLALKVFEPKRSEHHMVLLAISSQPPHEDQEAIEVPDTERRRGGLTRYPSAWVVTSEFNYDVAERSFYFDPAGRVLGSFSPTFLRVIAAALKRTLARNQRRVDRID